MQRLADTVLLQLVREMYAHFEDPEAQIDIKDWLKMAKRFVEEPAGKRRG